MPSDEDGSGEPAAPQPSSFRPVRDAEEFRLAAIKIFGRIGWKKNTALAFGVMETTIYRWVSEAVDLPHYAASAMAAWLLVFEMTGQSPPLAEDKTESSQQKGPQVRKRLPKSVRSDKN